MDPLETCVRIAKNSGAPREQVDFFLRVGYVPLPWQWWFHSAAREADNPDGPVDIGTGGARGPGKSHAVLSQAALDDCQRVSNLKGLFLRQTGSAAQESFDDLVNKAIRDKVPYKKTRMKLEFPNGSSILLGGFRDYRDIDKYVGIEYDFIIVEELNQITEDKYTKLRGSLRTSKPNWRPRMYTSFNPGGVGHGFVKDRYVTPYREDRENKTRFLGATYRDNPYLNDEYIDYLEDLKGDLGRAWRDGDWDVFAGQVFKEFSYEKHVIPFVVPKSTFTHGLGTDWGYSGLPSHKGAFASVGVALTQPKYDGQTFNRVIVYNEWYWKHKTPDQSAEIIYNDYKDLGRTPTLAVADSAMFNNQQDGSEPIEKLMRKKFDELNKGYWLTYKRGTKNRIQRVASLHNWLSEAPDGLPYILFTENCHNTIRTIPELQHDEHKGKAEDVATEGEDHCLHSHTELCTMRGVKKIKDLVGTSGYVRTVGGWTKYRNCRRTRRKAKTIKLVFSDGSSLVCTPDHKILHESGKLVPAENMLGEKCYTLRKFQTPYKNSKEEDTTCAENTLEKKGNFFIGRFIGKILEIYQRTAISITLTAIGLIINLKTWFALIEAYTYQCMQKKRITQIGSRRCRKVLRSGMVRKRVEDGIRSITRTLSTSFTGKESSDVRSVISPLHLRLDTPSTAVQTAVRKQEEKVVRTTSLKSVPFVKSLLRLISIVRLRLVREHAGQSLEVVGIKPNKNEDVYCLVADKTHVFSLSNGVVVSNCYDALTYLLGHIKYIPLKKGGINTRTEGKKKGILPAFQNEIDVSEFERVKRIKKRDWRSV